MSTFAALGPGLLKVEHGWWHEIDSSKWAFAELGQLLIPLLLLPNTASHDDVINAWVRQNSERNALGA